MSRRDVGAEIIITTFKIQTRWMVKEFGRAIIVIEGQVKMKFLVISGPKIGDAYDSHVTHPGSASP